MSNSHHPETNPYVRRQRGLPPADHQPSSPVAQVSPPLAAWLPAQPQGHPQPQPQLSQPHAPRRYPTIHAAYPLQPRDRGLPRTRSSSAPQPPPQLEKTRRPKGPPVEPPQLQPVAPSWPPPHNEQTQPLQTHTGVSPASVQAPPRHSPQSLLVPPPGKTKFHTWFLATFCAIFGIIITVGGLIVLIVYLIYRPHLPKFNISSATLNAAYLDMDYLLNADLTLLANFTNQNRKVRNDFSYVILDLYYGGNAVATQYIEPFSMTRLESRLANVEMISSQVRLPSKDSEKLKKQLESNGLVAFEVKGLVRVRSKFGSLLRYPYWLYIRCSIALTGPPSGVLRASQCRTKR